ncbi:MAG: SIS domain-containing protein, partial [candidate division WOR-3 bacterium]
MRASLPTLMHELVWGLPEQLAAALELKQTVQLKRSHSVGNVVVLGMGGSAIVGDLVRCLLQEESKTPVFVWRDYHIPRFVTKESLVIVVSYGGGTEETISAYQEATPCRPAFVVVTSGGKLAEMAAANR